MADRQALRDPEHNIIYGAVLDLREDFLDLKQHVNDELEVQRAELKMKAEKRDLTLLVLWRQSPTWLKIVGAIATVSGGILAAVAARLPI